MNEPRLHLEARQRHFMHNGGIQSVGLIWLFLAFIHIRHASAIDDNGRTKQGDKLVRRVWREKVAHVAAWCHDSMNSSAA